MRGWIMQWRAGQKVGTSLNGGYPLHLSNSPGVACIQQLGLIEPKGWHLRSNSADPASVQTIGDFTIHAWQEQLSAQGSFSVDVVLEHSNP